MTEEPIRVYADTSVFGGVFDDEFSGPSSVFFDQIRQGRFVLVLSPLVEDELERAPQRVRDLLTEMESYAELADVSPSVVDLQEAYLREGVVSEKFSDDALHVALATVTGCAVIVSWNFKHIVHFDKIPLYNAIGQQHGYARLAIHSPREVIEDDDQDI